MNCLPHPITISKWYRKIYCTSGINDATLTTIRRKVESERKKHPDCPVLVNVVMDKMKVRKKIELVTGKEYGYIDIGKGVDGYEAENAFVVMAVAENGD